MSVDVTLSSSLNGTSTAYPQQVITFTCITRRSSVLSWSSDDYIGLDGALLTFLAFEPIGTTKSSINSDTVAMLVSNGNENGETVLESTLQITVSSQFPMSSVACHNTASGTVNSITFHIPG